MLIREGSAPGCGGGMDQSGSLLPTRITPMCCRSVLRNASGFRFGCRTYADRASQRARPGPLATGLSLQPSACRPASQLTTGGSEEDGKRGARRLGAWSASGHQVRSTQLLMQASQQQQQHAVALLHGKRMIGECY